MTSRCIRRLYFMRNLCFLGVTITFCFMLGWFLFVFAQFLRAEPPFSSVRRHVLLHTLLLFLHLNDEACFLGFFFFRVYATSSVKAQTQRRSCFLRVFTPLSQLIFSLAGILTQRRPSCNTSAWQELLRSHPAGAWPLARHTCQMKNQWRFSGNYSLLRSIVTPHISLETNTHCKTFRKWSAKESAFASQ